MERNGLAYWDRIAVHWRIAPPLSPSAAEISAIEHSAQAFADTANTISPFALLLGVTPAIARMRWPPGTTLLAADLSAAMIRHHWPADGVPPGARAIRADWRELPLPDSARHLVIGDGCYTALGSLDAAARLNREISRVLKPGGLYCLRCFVRPDRPPSAESLFQELFAGHARNPHLFRWLLAMAMQGDSPQGVLLDAVWREWNEQVADARAAIARCGWPERSDQAFERMRGMNTRFYFPRAADLRQLAEPLFDVVEFRVPDFEWGECFPTLVMRSRKNAQ